MMRLIAKPVCRVLYALGVWQMLLLLERQFGWRNHAVLLLYHHIRADDETLPHLSQVEEGVGQTAFEAQLRAFSRWYQPCKPAELHSALAGSSALKQDKLVVTFDDGYRDNRTLAGPVLRGHGVTGLIFIATGYIESTRRFWWTRVNDVVRSFSDESLAVARASSNGSSRLTPILARASVKDHSRRRDLRIRVAETLESLTDDCQQAELDRLECIAGRIATQCLPLLNWSEIREMQREGFEFGAHTVTHPKLSRITANRLREEIVQSVETLREETDVRSTAFAYPYGDSSPQVEAEVRQAGFEAAYAACPGAVVPGRTCRYKIPRIQLYASDPAHLAVLIVGLKLSKYMPRLMRPVLSRFFGEPFEI